MGLSAFNVLGAAVGDVAGLPTADSQGQALPSLAPMLDKTVTIRNKLGLHARAAVKFVNLANRFGASVKIVKDGNEIDGKSILGILTLAATQGTQIRLQVSGKDEESAMEALVELINNRFDEKE